MGLYRVIRKLSLGDGKFIRAGVISTLTMVKPSTRDILATRNYIAPVSTPPLTEIPELENKATLLAKIDIVTLEDFLLADDALLARRIKRRRGSIAGFKVQLTERYLQVERLHDG